MKRVRGDSDQEEWRWGKVGLLYSVCCSKQKRKSVKLEARALISINVGLQQKLLRINNPKEENMFLETFFFFFLFSLSHLQPQPPNDAPFLIPIYLTDPLCNFSPHQIIED